MTLQERQHIRDMYTTVSLAADLLNINIQQVHYLIRLGRLDAEKIGSTFVLLRSDVQAVYSENETALDSYPTR